MDNYQRSFQDFVNSGDLLQLTRNFPELRQEAQVLPWTHCHASLLDVGVLLIKPLAEQQTTAYQKNKNIIISCGIHGNETAPIEIVNTICINIASGKTKVENNLLLIIGNPPAMIEGKRFLDENLNRLFRKSREDKGPEDKGSKTSLNKETQRAEKLMTYVEGFFASSENYHYDLHTAIRPSTHEKFAIYPYLPDANWSLQQLAFLQLSGINTILFSHAPAGTFSYHSSNIYHAHAFTLELGQVKEFGQNDMTKFDKILRSLQALIENHAFPNAENGNKKYQLYLVCHEVINTSSEFRFFVDNDVSNFTAFPIDTLIWEDGENAYRTKVEGEAIVFPNPQVPIGQRVALMIKPTSLSSA